MNTNASTCNYNSKLRNPHRHTMEVKNDDRNINMEMMSKNGSDSRMYSI